MSASSGARTEARHELIGRRREDLPTPALLLDLERARANVGTLADRVRGHVDLRPHAKIHKSAELAAIQLAAGAKGVTVATVREALALVDRGIDDVFIANEVVGADKLRALARLAGRCELSVAVDDNRHVESLSAACAAAGTRLRVMIDVDVGVGRCGVRGASEAVALAGRIVGAPALELHGVMGYEGHTMLIADPAARRDATLQAYSRLESVVSALRASGFPVPVVSAGGTGTYDIATSHRLITEIRAGSYLLMDGSYLPIVPEFAVATSVLATVISSKASAIILDCGVKAVDIQMDLPMIATVAAHPRYAAEEHLGYELAGESRLEVGATVELLPWQCGPTVNLHPYYHVVENGSVVDIWPVLARGPGVVGAPV